jgi:hypothetical protein
VLEQQHHQLQRRHNTPSPSCKDGQRSEQCRWVAWPFANFTLLSDQLANTSNRAILLSAGLISLLSDTDPEIQSYAITELNEVVPLFWAEISEVVAEMYVALVYLCFVTVCQLIVDPSGITARLCRNLHQLSHLNLVK